METTLNELARNLVGTGPSPFFVTILNEMEFDGAPTTIAAFMSYDDAENFAESIAINSNEAIYVEGPKGTYLELTRGTRISFMEGGVLAVMTPEGKTTMTTH